MNLYAKPLIGLAGLACAQAALQPLGCAVSVGITCSGDVFTRAALIATAFIPVPILILSLAVASKGWDPLRCKPAMIPWLVGALCLLTGALAGTFWPNSGDEHAYVFLADTFLAGRLSNPPPPDLELFKLFHVFTIGDKTFGQFPPGWPLVLAPFRAAGLDWLANPLLTVLMGVSLLGAMRRLGIEPKVQSSALLLVLVSPFVLFNGGSMFSHTLCGAMACMIAWQQLADEDQPSLWRKVVIGALFGILLLARYEVFAILAGLFAADRLWYGRRAAFIDAVPIVLGILPACLFHLAYDWAITGDPLLTPAALTNPGATFQEALINFWDMAARATDHMLFWTALLGLFGGFTLAALQLPALAHKLKCRNLRFYDLALPATILFFLYFPYDGGHQYGPRYWFFAWPLSALTVVTGLVAADGTFPLGAARRAVFGGVVAANLMVFAISMPWLIATTRAYIDARREVYAAVPPITPAIVLVPDRALQLWPWPRHSIPTYSLDFARNDVDFSGPLLYGLLDAPDAIERACGLRGRAVLTWSASRALVPAACMDKLAEHR
jgi:hypothetical protein